MSGLKNFARAVLRRTVLRPPYVRYCSQTIYQSLLGCLRMFEATSQSKWSQRADHLLSILLQIQQPDGGFDIGYDFNFGLMHKKGQSTSPELVALVALAEYARIFGKDKVLTPAQRAADWIRKNAIDKGDGQYAIPYSPYTTDEVMVYNGTSFAAGALGCYLGHIENDQELDKIYRGMVLYLKSVMSSAPDLPGKFWYYNDQSLTNLTEMQRMKRTKIDYYHQMQQVEMHALAQQAHSAQSQLDIITDAADLIAALQEKHEVIPYTNSNFYFKGCIHLWGLASVASGMLEASVVVPERKTTYHTVARRVVDWIVQHAWNGEHFVAVLDKTGTAVSCDYMVRSDAWVFNALAAAQKHLGPGPWTELAENAFLKMDSVDYSGPESHASTRKKRLIVSLYSRIYKVKNTVPPEN